MPKIVGEQNGGYLVELDDGTKTLMAPSPALDRFRDPSSQTGVDIFNALTGKTSPMDPPEPPGEPAPDNSAQEPLPVWMRPRVKVGKEDLVSKITSGAVPQDVAVGAYLNGQLTDDQLTQLVQAGAIDPQRAARAQSSMQFAKEQQADRDKPPQGGTVRFVGGSSSVTQPPPALARAPGVSAKGLREAFDSEKDALTAQSELQAAQLDAEAGLRDRQVAIERDFAAKQAGINREYERVVNDGQQRLQGYIDQVAEMRVDPKRLWKSASTGNKILAAVSMAAGALSAALVGGDNPALRIIDRAIERDIQSQLVDIDQAKGRVADQRGMLALARQKFSDRSAAEAAAKAAAYDAVGAEITALQTRHAGKLNAAALEQTKAQIDQRKEAALMQVRQYNQNLALQHAAMVAKAAGMGPALSKDDIKRFHKIKEGYNRINRAVATIRELRAQHGRELLPQGLSGPRTRANAAASDITLAIKDLEELGAIQKADLDAIGGMMVNDPLRSGLSDAALEARLKALEQYVNDKQRDFMETRGLAAPQPTEADVAASFGGGV